MGVAARVRHGRADGQRYHQPPGRALPGLSTRPAVLSGVGDRLFDRLSDGLRRDGGARPPHTRRRELARARLARADRPLAARPRRGAGGSAEGRAVGVHARRARALDDRERDAGGTAAPSGAGGAPVRNTAAVVSAVCAARLPPAGVAGADEVTARLALSANLTIPTALVFRLTLCTRWP